MDEDKLMNMITPCNEDVMTGAGSNEKRCTMNEGEDEGGEDEMRAVRCQLNTVCK